MKILARRNVVIILSIIVVTLLFHPIILMGQVTFTSTGGKMFISGGGVNMNGKIVLDSFSVIENKGLLKSDSLKNKGDVLLIDSTSQLIIDSGLVLQEGQLQLTTNKLVILNSDSSALQVTNGKLRTNDSLFYGKVQWYISQNSGQKYIVPFCNDSFQDVSMEFQVTNPGLGLEGYVEFSSYHTNYDNEPLPLDTASDAARMLVDSPLEIADRFWKIEPVNYTNAPSSKITVRYAQADTSGTNTLMHDSLILSRWNNNCWTKVPGAIDSSSKKYQSDTVNQYGLLVLHDKNTSKQCNDGHSCDFALKYTHTDYSGLLIEMNDTLIWVKFTAEDDSVNLFRFNTADTNALNLKRTALYAGCGDTILQQIAIGNVDKTKYAEFTQLIPGKTYYLKFFRKSNGYLAKFWLDSPDLRLFANVATECNDTSATDSTICLWFSDYSNVYPQQTFNKLIWKVYTTDSNQLVYTDTTVTDSSRLNAFSLTYGEYYYELEERNVKNILLRTWYMPDYVNTSFSLKQGEPVEYDEEIYDEEDFSNEEIDTEAEVGSILGFHNTTPSGGASYTIPISIPVGTNGMVPEIALSYNSHSGNGVAGMGWDISGLPVIARVGRDWFHSNNRVKAVNFNADDWYALDGNLLICTSGSYGGDGAIYGTESETFSIISSHGTFAGISQNPSNFEVVTKDGLRMLFGHTIGSKLLSEDKKYVILYRLSLLMDNYGNYITFKYDNSERESKIVEIAYTGNLNQSLAPYNKVKFEYGDRFDKSTHYVGSSSCDESKCTPSCVAQNTLLTSIVISGEANSHFKTYELNYANDGMYSYLKDITLKGANMGALNKTKFKYGDSEEEVEPVESDAVLNESVELFTGDFNGDGFTDLLAASKTWSSSLNDFYHSSYKIRYKDPNPASSDFNAGSNVSLPNDFSIVCDVRVPNPLNFIAADYNGDGKDDVAIAKRYWDGDNFRLARIKIHLSGSESDTISFLPPLGYNIIHPNGNFLFPGDFDGDGRFDFISVLSNLSGFGVFISYPARNIFNRSLDLNIYATYQGGLIVDADKCFVVDVDGDNKHELMVIDEYICDIFIINSVAFSAQRIEPRSGFPSGWHDVFPGDFNGDGKTDVLTRYESEWRIGYSTGKSFLEQKFNSVNGGFAPLPEYNVADYLMDKLAIADFNGDGKSDILHSFNNGYGGDPKIAVYYSQSISPGYLGDNKFLRKEFDYDHYDLGTNSGNIHNPFICADYNGDGKADAINRKSKFEPFVILYFNPLGTEKLLDKVMNGFGQIVDFEHKPLTTPGDPDFHIQGTTFTYPLNEVQPPIYAVASIATSDGAGGYRTTHYRYENAKYQREGLGFLGFTKVITRNEVMDLRTVTQYKLYEFLGRIALPAVLKEETYLYDFTPVSTSENTNIFQPGLSANSYFHYVKEFKETNHITGSVKTSINGTLDGWGNVLKNVVTIQNGLEVVITKFDNYCVCGGAVRAKPQKITVTKSRAQHWWTPKYITELAYNTEGAVTSKIEYKGYGERKMEYEYDDFGNVQEETLSSPLLGLVSRTNDYVYDSKGRYPLEIRNALNQLTEYEYHPFWGKPISILPPSGISTEYDYDEWGRLETETQRANAGSDAVEISTIYDWDIDDDIYSVFFRQTTHEGLPDVKIWYDMFSREVYRETEGFHGAIMQEIVYDADGMVASKTAPHYSGEDILTTDFTYDHKQLHTATNHFGTTTYEYTYPGDNVKIEKVDNAGESTYTTIDPAGRLIESEDNGGILKYAYNADGEVTTVHSNNKLVLLNLYDLNGRKSKTWDVNAGDVLYTYNPYGELVQQRDAKDIANGTSTQLYYDLLGRMWKRTGPEGTTEYHFVSSGPAVNQVEEVIGFNGNNVEYDYDGYGRLETVTESLGILSFATHYSEYDKYDNIKEIEYPDGLIIKKEYQSGTGVLTNIKNSSGLTTIFHADAYNGLGQCKQYTLGNGKTTTISYEHGLPTRFLTPNGATDIQDLILEYHPQHWNITERRNERTSNVLTENFVYDDLYRLEGASVTAELGGGPVSIYSSTVSYLDNGNIKTKTEAGNYRYHSHRINALTEIRNSAGNISTKTQNVNYTSYHQPQEITEQIGTDNYALTYQYGHDYQRRIGILSINGNTEWTRIYLGDYEIMVEDPDGSNISNHIHYINSPAGLVCMAVDAGSGNEFHYTYTDHLGSIIAVTEPDGDMEYEQSFDAWGRRRNHTSWAGTSYSPTLPAWLYRGFTGHEHLDDFALINMNGRLYDPIVGRMLSVDNYVQRSFNTQGYNRYSYAWNNPMKYTDPTGQFGLIFGLGNLIIRSRNDEIDNFKDAFRAFSAGYIAGSVTGPISMVRSTGFATHFGLITGFGRGYFKDDWTSFENAVKIFGGNFYLDGNRSFAFEAWQGISRFTWEEFTSHIGQDYSQIRNALKMVDEVDYFGGVTFSTWKHKPLFETRGVSFGNFVNLNDELGFFIDADDALAGHEFGHTFESMLFGPLYLIVIGIPSASDANWTEQLADDHWYNYYYDYYLKNK